MFEAVLEMSLAAKWWGYPNPSPREGWWEQGSKGEELGQRGGKEGPGQTGREGRQERERKSGRERRGKKLVGKQSVKGEEKKDGLGGREAHRDTESFVTT